MFVDVNGDIDFPANDHIDWFLLMFLKGTSDYIQGI
jgi:hypothetical protein